MAKKIFFLFFCLVSITAFGQKNKLQVLSNEKIFGKNLLDSSEIKGFEYIFHDRIHEVFIDTTTGFLTAQLRGVSKNGKWLDNKGNIIQYDLNNNNFLWSKKIAYQKSYLQQFSNTMIYTTGNKSNFLDIYTGKELWTVKNNILFVDPIDKIGIGYKYKNSDDDIQGVDLNNGNVIWTREIDRDYGWNNVFYINDSTMIVVAAGLHAINIHNGDGWDYNTITGEKDYSGTNAANAVGAVLGVFTGTFVLSTGYNLVRDVVSNALVDSSYIYLASKTQLAKLDKETGYIIWKYLLPENLTSKSSIFMNDSTVFMINKGFAFMGSRQLNFGTPFIAAFDRQTGEQKYFSEMPVKKDPILDFEILDNEIYIVFKNRIAKYSKETGNLTAEKEFPKDSYGELKYFLGDQIFVPDQNGDLISLSQSDSGKVFVYTNQENTLSIDNQLNVTNTIEYENLNLYYLRTKEYKFIAKDKNTLIVNNEGKKIAEIEATSNAFMIKGILYDKQDNRFIAIDLNTLFKNE